MSRSRWHRQGTRHLLLAIPVTTVVLAFTAIPVALRPPRVSWSALFDTSPDLYDVAVNVLGYLPLGAVFATRGPWSAVGIATVISGFAETTQLFTPGRAPSVIDLATNILGAFLGWALARRWRIPPVWFEVTPKRGLAASALALGCLGLMSLITPRELEDSVTAVARALTVLGLPANDRGAAAPGALEAHWTFDEIRASRDEESNSTLLDTSGNGMEGSLANGPVLAPGIVGQALRLDGVNQYADFQNPVSLRLTGSMTVSAWINSSRFPRSDAVVVSNYGGLGYQLDTTVDEGLRTIAFRFTNAWGQLTSRYGATPLETNRWYHIAGVFDANARTLNVFLDGQLDNGCLASTVTSRQTISPDHLFIGRPALTQGFAFAGSIDDVRIYSRALSEDEIREQIRLASRAPSAAVGRRRNLPVTDAACRSTEPPDSRTAGLIVTLGVLVAVGAVGLWPSKNYRGAALALSVIAGILIAPTVTAKVPAYQWWLMPLLTLAGGVAVVASTRSDVAWSARDDVPQL